MRTDCPVEDGDGSLVRDSPGSCLRIVQHGCGTIGTRFLPGQPLLTPKWGLLPLIKGYLRAAGDRRAGAASANISVYRDCCQIAPVGDQSFALQRGPPWRAFRYRWLPLQRSVDYGCSGLVLGCSGTGVRWASPGLLGLSHQLVAGLLKPGAGQLWRLAEIDVV